MIICPVAWLSRYWVGWEVEGAEMGTPGTVMIGWPRLVEYCTPCLAKGRLAGEVCAAVVVGFGSSWGCFPLGWRFGEAPGLVARLCIETLGWS